MYMFILFCRAGVILIQAIFDAGVIYRGAYQ